MSSNSTPHWLRHAHATHALERQVGTSVRFVAGGADGGERARFEEAGRFAELVWAGGAASTAGLAALLERLVHPVTWAEALGRALLRALRCRAPAGGQGDSVPVPPGGEKESPAPCRERGAGG